MEEPPLTKGRFGISVKNNVGMPINRFSTEQLGALKLKENKNSMQRKIWNLLQMRLAGFLFITETCILIYTIYRSTQVQHLKEYNVQFD